MDETHILLTVAGIHLLALFSPGPDFALVVQSVSRYGRSTGVSIAFGLAAGILTHAVLSLTGVSLLVHHYPHLFAIIQGIGGGYLLYLGFSGLRYLLIPTKRPTASLCAADIPDTSAQPQNRHHAVIRGYLTNILNPKALVFFISLMSGLIPAGFPLSGKAIVLVILWGLAFGWFTLLAWLLSTERMQTRLRTVSRHIDLLCCTIFLLVGGLILHQAVLKLWHTFH
jgi:threonine/homoserine/homoserine lactone efflux protein